MFRRICLLLLCLGAGARADVEDFASPLWFGLEVRYGSVKLDSFLIDPGTGTSAAPAQAQPEIWFEWIPITAYGKLGVGLGYSHLFGRSTLFTTGVAQKLSSHNLEVGLSYRLDYFPNQYVVPFVRFALGSQFARHIVNEGSVETRANLARVSSTVLGVGAEVLLDWIEPRSAANLDRDFGINNLYLVAEYVQVMVSASAVARLGYDGWRFGMRFEF